MSDLDETIVALAVGAAGAADRGWSDRVASLIPKVGALFQEPSSEEDPRSATVAARKVREAHVFTAEFRDAELRQEDQRIYVRIFDKDRADQGGDNLDADGCQTIRTEPMWAASGRAVRAILNEMSSGQPAVFYRYTEPIDGGRKKMGVLVHVEPRRPRRQQSASDSGRGSAAAGTSSRTGSGEGAPAPSSSGAPDPHAAGDPAIAERFEQLDNRQRAAYMHATRAEGINGMLPADDQLDRALVLLGQVEKGEH